MTKKTERGEGGLEALFSLGLVVFVLWFFVFDGRVRVVDQTWAAYHAPVFFSMSAEKTVQETFVVSSLDQLPTLCSIRNITLGKKSGYYSDFPWSRVGFQYVYDLDTFKVVDPDTAFGLTDTTDPTNRDAIIKHWTNKAKTWSPDYRTMKSYKLPDGRLAVTCYSKNWANYKEP